MKTYIKFGYQGLLFDGIVDLKIFEHAQIVEQVGYETPPVLKPTNQQIEITLLPDTQDTEPLLKLLEQEKRDRSEQQSKVWKLENKLKKLCERFGVSEAE